MLLLHVLWFGSWFQMYLDSVNQWVWWILVWNFLRFCCLCCCGCKFMIWGLLQYVWYGVIIISIEEQSNEIWFSKKEQPTELWVQFLLSSFLFLCSGFVFLCSYDLGSCFCVPVIWVHLLVYFIQIWCIFMFLILFLCF